MGDDEVLGVRDDAGGRSWSQKGGNLDYRALMLGKIADGVEAVDRECRDKNI